MRHTHIRITLVASLICAVGIILPAFAQQTTTGACGNNYNYADGNRYMTSDYGPRTSQQGSQGATSSFHKGVDIRVNDGTPTSNSYMDGVVVQVGNQPGGYGNFVIVQHSNGFRTMYAHATSINVTTGQQITAGQVLGDYSGACTGNCTGPHIHYETQVLNSDGGWTKVDPAIVENLVAGGACPSDSAYSYFNMMAAAQTAATHGITAEQLRAGGQNLLMLNMCDD